MMKFNGGNYNEKWGLVMEVVFCSWGIVALWKVCFGELSVNGRIPLEYRRKIYISEMYWYISRFDLLPGSSEYYSELS